MQPNPSGWQSRMAPLMVGAVVLTAVFFAVVAIWKFGSIEARMMGPISAAPQTPWAQHPIAPTSFQEQLQSWTAQARYGLERELIVRRYEQANLSFATRLWTRFMGFVTGMILSMVGAAFVLGKLDSGPNEFGAGAQGLTFSLKSASPGLVLAVLGTLLMSLSILLPVTVETRDGAVYFTADIAPPPPITDVGSAAPTAPEPPLKILPAHAEVAQ